MEAAELDELLNTAIYGMQALLELRALTAVLFRTRSTDLQVSCDIFYIAT